jgi:hypothetical protein
LRREHLYSNAENETTEVGKWKELALADGELSELRIEKKLPYGELNWRLLLPTLTQNSSVRPHRKSKTIS